MPYITRDLVERLRPRAVRGTLTPGLYRRVFAPVEFYNRHGYELRPWTEDIYVEEAHIRGDGEYSSQEPTWFTYVNLDPEHFAYGRHMGHSLDLASLRDVGVLPQRDERRNAKMCDLGHTHIEVTPAKYNSNFIVPLSVAVGVK